LPVIADEMLLVRGQDLDSVTVVSELGRRGYYAIWVEGEIWRVFRRHDFIRTREPPGFGGTVLRRSASITPTENEPQFRSLASGIPVALGGLAVVISCTSSGHRFCRGHQNVPRHPISLATANQVWSLPRQQDPAGHQGVCLSPVASLGLASSSASDLVAFGEHTLISLMAFGIQPVIWVLRYFAWVAGCPKVDRQAAVIGTGLKFVPVPDGVSVSVPVARTVPISLPVAVSAVVRIRGRDRKHPPRIVATAIVTPAAAVSVVACVVVSVPSVSTVESTSVPTVPSASESCRSRHRKDRQQDQKFCFHDGNVVLLDPSAKWTCRNSFKINAQKVEPLPFWATHLAQQIGRR
jgi:hypothetical protein